MTTLILPNDIVNLTPADATQVEQNYSVIESYINAECITRDGSVAMQQPLLLVGDPTQPDHAANKEYVDSVLPVGVIFPYGGIAAPAGGKWALCNGATMAKSTYQDLFDVIGYRFGGSDASFNLPNLAGRMPIGVGVGVDIDAVGKVGGTTTPPLRQHTHDNYHDHPQVNSGYHSADHTHGMSHDHPQANTATASANHTHRILGSTASAGNHVHGFNTGRGPIAAHTGGSINAAPSGEMSEASMNTAGAHTHSMDFNSGGMSADHLHTYNVPAFSGNTGGASANHYHTVNIPAYTGATGNVAGGATAVETAYRPPFIVFSFLIRIV